LHPSQHQQIIIIKGWARRYMNTNMKRTTTLMQQKQHQQHEKNNSTKVIKSTIQCENSKNTMQEEQ
jgi:hypothetical protein